MPERVLEMMELTGEQLLAARSTDQNVALTAGAGSGKTRTLTARYLALLAGGLEPHQVAAITFTEKAARQMRGGIREALAKMGGQGEVEAGAEDMEARDRWEELLARMDSARIGTIHSLCAEILRSHPAEAGVDPGFEVLDERVSAVVRGDTVEETLAWAAGQEALGPLFNALRTHSLAGLLADYLNRRLEARGVEGEEGEDWTGALAAALRNPELTDPVAELREFQADGSLEALAGNKLADQVAGMLSRWGEVEGAAQAGDWVAAAGMLYAIRRSWVRGNIGKAGPVKEAVKAFRLTYDVLLDPWLGGQKSSDAPPEAATEAAYAAALPALEALFSETLRRYRVRLEARGALDFDDLEGLALELLGKEAVRTRWQGTLAAVLVDETQDTNLRQQGIIEALAGEEPGRLFVVGDARQSIYRFRGADVAGFVRARGDIAAGGGVVRELSRTFRSHQALLSALEALLVPIMGTETDPDRPYQVPFTPLAADRDAPKEGVAAPHVEFVVGRGRDAGAGREAAAGALARRLLALKEAGQIGDWGEVALLFRASTHFGAYEDALEAHGVPYVTVAGRGFYNRPEVRDMLGLLAALADPWDDLALAGLLRSPAFGLPDAEIYSLRQGEDPVPLRTALELAVGMGEAGDGRNPGVRQEWEAADESQPAAETDQAAAGRLAEAESNEGLHAGITHTPAENRSFEFTPLHRALAFLEELGPLAGRVTIGELLKAVLDWTDYRAVLATVGQARLWRNIDKLQADAYASGLVHVRDFLAYLAALREAGAREGEAAPEAAGSLQLMSVHKAKGLEFPVVILADAGHTGRYRASPAYFLPATGAAYRLDRLEGDALAYRYARGLDQEQDGAERNRLLYVALTRAQEKLLVSGHVVERKQPGGWLKELLEAAGARLPDEPGVEGGMLVGGEPVRLELAAEVEVPNSGQVRPRRDTWSESGSKPAAAARFAGDASGVRRSNRAAVPA